MLQTILNNVKVVSGRILLVENTNRPTFSFAKKQYYALWIQDSDGKNEECIMWTQRELDAILKRTSSNPEDVHQCLITRLDDRLLSLDPDRGRVYRIQNTNKKYMFEHEFYNAIYVDTDSNPGKRFFILVTDHELNSGRVRASKNKEDIPKKNFLINLLD